ncbi:MAG TPA: hypothetical protein VNW99_06680 [Cytophagaceae bacterium]|jgi:hypothetical protein|nr:hypothetical protein [Cytophagaceae bacterium]
MKDHNQIKQYFLNRIENKFSLKLNREQSAILDECIENLLNGNSTIDGKVPESDDEIFVVLGYGFTTAYQALQGMLSGIYTAYGKDTRININYRGQEFAFQKG